MRRKEREITDFQQIIKVVDACDCCRIGLVDNDDAYIVPLNYGYETEGKKLMIYFHCATKGRKIDLLNKNKCVSFEMDTNHELVSGEKPCDYTYKYASIMGKGTVKELEVLDEKIHGLNVIMSHYSEKADWTYNEKVVEHTNVLKLEVTQMTCKAH